jgi:kynurenine formamidase
MIRSLLDQESITNIAEPSQLVEKRESVNTEPIHEADKIIIALNFEWQPRRGSNRKYEYGAYSTSIKNKMIRSLLDQESITNIAEPSHLVEKRESVDTEPIREADKILIALNFEWQPRRGSNRKYEYGAYSTSITNKMIRSLLDQESITNIAEPSQLVEKRESVNTEPTLLALRTK